MDDIEHVPCDLIEGPERGVANGFHLGVFHFALPEVPVVWVGSFFKLSQSFLAGLDDFLGIAAGLGASEGSFVFANDGIQFVVADFSFHACTLSHVFVFVNRLFYLRMRIA